MIKEIFSFISAPVTQYLKNRGEKNKAKHERDIAIINNQASLAQDKASNNHEWEMANLQDKDKGLRWISFTLFTLPIVITVIDPEAGTKIWTSLKVVPEHFLAIYYTMIGGVWGIASLKNAVPQLIAGLRGK